MNIKYEARQHSMVNKYAWIMSNGKDTYYTDSDVIVSNAQDNGYQIIAEYIDGYQTK